MTRSAFSPRYESRSPFSPRYESRSPFSPRYRSRSAFAKVVSSCESRKTKSFDDKRNLYREILEKNKKLWGKIKTNMEAYKKNQNDLKIKARAFNASDEKFQEMMVNVRVIEISFDEFYNDERKQIVKDIQEAKQIIEILK